MTARESSARREIVERAGRAPAPCARCYCDHPSRRPVVLSGRVRRSGAAGQRDRPCVHGERRRHQGPGRWRCRTTSAQRLLRDWTVAETCVANWIQVRFQEVGGHWVSTLGHIGPQPASPRVAQTETHLTPGRTAARDLAPRTSGHQILRNSGGESGPAGPAAAARIALGLRTSLILSYSGDSAKFRVSHNTRLSLPLPPCLRVQALLRGFCTCGRTQPLTRRRAHWQALGCTPSHTSRHVACSPAMSPAPPTDSTRFEQRCPPTAAATPPRPAPPAHPNRRQSLTLRFFHSLGICLSPSASLPPVSLSRHHRVTRSLSLPPNVLSVYYPPRHCHGSVVAICGSQEPKGARAGFEICEGRYHSDALLVRVWPDVSSLQWIIDDLSGGP